MAELFPVVSRVVGDTRRSFQVITCACGREDRLSAHRGRAPEHTVRTKFARLGWEVRHAAPHVCPDCRAAKAAGAISKEPPMASKPLLAPKPPMNTPAPGKVSPAALEARAELFLLLAEHYDGTRKAYRGGWTDARLADKTGLSVDLVARERETHCGPLVVDTARADLARELTEARQKAEYARRLAGDTAAAMEDVEARLVRIGDLADKVLATDASEAA